MAQQNMYSHKMYFSIFSLHMCLSFWYFCSHARAVDYGTLRFPPPAFALNPSSWTRITMHSQSDPSSWVTVTRLKKKRSKPHSLVVLQQIQTSVRTPPPLLNSMRYKCTCKCKQKRTAVHTVNIKQSKIPSLHCRNSKCTDIQLI